MSRRSGGWLIVPHGLLECGALSPLLEAMRRPKSGDKAPHSKTSAPQQGVAVKLEVIRRPPAPDAQLALAAEARRLVARDLGDPQPAPGRAGRQQRFPA